MRLYPSMMCADFAHLEREVRELEQAGVDGFHLDVMDGHFVPNYALGLGDVAAICAMTELSCDTHLMVSNPLDVAPRRVSPSTPAPPSRQCERPCTRRTWCSP